MPETRSAQGALPLRSAYPARDLTHSTGRRAISPDKTTGIPGKRLWPSFLFVQCRTQSALDIFHRPYTLRSKDEERPDIDLLSWIAVLRSIGCGPFFHGAGSAVPSGEASWYQALRTGLSQFRNGGGYETSREAMQALAEKACRWDPRTRRPVFLLRNAAPSFCSSACYLLLLKSLQIWDSAQPRPVISERAWLALIPRFGQHDGEGPWGWANANGPGLAVLVHRLGAGINFEDWRKARPGDFMKIFWTDRIGRRESGHLTVLVKDGGDQVTFWSSNIPDGYGARTVPKSRIRRVIFTRITRPERFNLAPSVGSHPWLSSLLRQEVGMKEVRRHSGMQNP